MSYMGHIPVFAMMVNASLGAGFYDRSFDICSAQRDSLYDNSDTPLYITLAISLMIVEISSRTESLLHSKERKISQFIATLHYLWYTIWISS